MPCPLGKKHSEETRQRIREGKARYSAVRRADAALLDKHGEKTVMLHTSENKTPFLIDADDYEAVSYYTWGEHQGYVETKIGTRPNRRAVRLHIFLLGPATNGLEWDHRNRNTLDNRRENLRAVTHSVNMLNRDLQPNNTSGHAGVSQIGTKWSAKIQVNRKSIWLGSFDTIEEAVVARQAADKLYAAGARHDVD